MLNAISPVQYESKLSCHIMNNRVNFKANPSVVIMQKSSHKCEIIGRRMLNCITGLLNCKFINEADKILSQVDRNSPEYIYAVAGAGRVFAQKREVEINSEDGIIERLAKSKTPHIFIMNHDNQKADPQMLGFFNTMLNEEYVVNDIAETCPRPRVILNEDILSTMNTKMRNIFEKLGSVGIDASLSGGNKASNGRKMIQLMKEYIDGKSNIFIFPEGKNCIFKDRPLKERFQPGIASIISRLNLKTDVSVVHLGFAYNKKNKSLAAIEIGEPIIFKKDVSNNKDEILQTMCDALEMTVDIAKSKIPQSVLGEKAIYI